VWEAETGKELHSLTGHEGGVYSVSWSPDGNRLATASNDGTVRVWDAGSGGQLLTITVIAEGSRSQVWNASWSPDGHWLASGSDDGTARIWDANTGKELLTLRGHSCAVTSVAWSPDSKRLVIGSEDHTAKVWAIGRESSRR
jgi:WD40 repeat protein